MALFLELYKMSQRKKIYQALEKSCIKKTPLVHARNDMEIEEFKFLKDSYSTKCFTIHEDSFRHLGKWKGFWKYLYLEMNKDDSIAKNVKVEKIGGFCVDLSHFKSAEEKWSKEFEYTIKRRNKKNLFVCNHLNGYSYKENEDLH